MQPLDADDPSFIGPYRLLGRLGSGGMGRVYLGRSPGGRAVAVKSVHPHFAFDDGFRRRFRHEVEAARRVGGDWTAPVLDADPDAQVPWVATGYVSGPSLAEAVATGDGATNPLPLPTVRVLGASLAEALAHMHSLGLVHRDVKPSNVLLTLDGPRLIDFGIARATDGSTSLTATGASIGSPGYMAPEQINATGLTGAVDVFSLGTVLAFAGRGRPPFTGGTPSALLYKVVYEEPELDGLEADPDLLDVVRRCLAKDPDARPAPQELARLVPGGASAAIAAGWLPAPLVADLGRTATRLLDLDAGVSSEPVTYQQVADTGTHAPPDAPSATTPFSSTGYAAAPPASWDAPPEHGQAQTPYPSEPFNGSGTAYDKPGGKRRGRRTVALAITAVCVAAVGLVLLALLLRQNDKDTADGNNPAGTQSASTKASASTSASAHRSPTATSQPPTPAGGDNGAAGQSSSPSGGIPTGYIGTYRGKGTRDIAPSDPPDFANAGTFDVTISEGDGAPGKQFGEVTQKVTQTDSTIECHFNLILGSANEQGIVATGEILPKEPSTCAQNPFTLHLTPYGDALKLTTDLPSEGNPHAVLNRVS